MSGADLLRTEVDAVVAEWVERFDRSPIRLHRRTSASALAAVVVQLVEGLASGVDVGPDALAAGRAEVRELERACAFLGGHMAAIGAGGFDVAAALVAFRDAVAPRCGPAFAPALASISEWLMIVAMDSFASAALQAVREQMRDQLEHRAFHDGLTGLPNRARFLQQLEESVTRPAPVDEQAFRVAHASPSVRMKKHGYT